ncbi:MAG TPA: hypothetical protein VNC50_18760, partial [Planctomycetia bacterium]|nr:hypothetical protein [Planctomycetia bacterium]
VALIVFAVALRRFGERIALLAGLVQLSVYYTPMQARLAECDMLFCLLATACLALFGESEVPGPRPPLRGRWVRQTFYACLAAAALSKGPLAVVLVGGPIALWFLWTRSRDRLLHWLQPAALLAFVLPVAGWYLAAYRARPELLDGWLWHNLDRFRGGMGEASPWYFYLGQIPLLLLPWTPLVLWEAWAGRRDAGANVPFRQFLLCWLLPGLMVLSASSWKHKHYAIPLLPALSILGALGLARLSALPFPAWLRPSRSMFVVAGWLSAVLLTALCVKSELRTALAGLASVIPAGLVAALVFHFERRPRASSLALFGTVWAATLLGLCFGLPAFDSYRGQRDFAARANGLIGAAETLELVFSPPHTPLPLPENQVAYYLRPGWKVVRAEELLAEPLGRPRLILGPLDLAEELRRTASVEILDQSPRVRAPLTESKKMTLFRVVPELAQNAR